MSKDVKSYYDQNTTLFLKLSGNESTSSIHQPIWFEGTASRQEALNNTNELIYKEITDKNAEKIALLDLGCGVGGSIFYLLRKLPQSVAYGITISPKQVEMAIDLATRKKLGERAVFLEGSFLNIPDQIPQADLIFSIEAFVHSPDADKFLIEAYTKLKPGGKLVLIDDFLADSFTGSPADYRVVEDFKNGWMLTSLIKTAQLQEAAEKAGFEDVTSEDLTPFLAINSTRDKLIRLYLRSFRWLMKNTSYFKSQIGGDARQVGLMKGLIQYRKVVMRKS